MRTTRLDSEGDHDYGTFRDTPIDATVIVWPHDSPRKWLMLTILSILSAMNQGVCYSYALIAGFAETRWEQRLHSTDLITVFFIAYIPCSFLGSWLMDKKGLRYGVLLGAFLQAVGAAMRYFATFPMSMALETKLTAFGQVLASVAMPFMVNSPPVLSANWFPPSQRATATSIAINANAVGTALVYLTAPFIVHDTEGIPVWNLGVALVSIACFAVAAVVFESFPSSVTAADDAESIVSDVQLHEEYDWRQWANAFTHKGFWHTVVAFSVTECIVNAISALLGKMLGSEHFSKSQIGVIGTAFVVSSLVGSQIISGYVDHHRNHTQAMLFCLVTTVVSLAAFKVTLPLDGTLLSLSSLMAVGAFLGPLQPIALEAGVECAFPTSEATVAALQQLCGNFLSALVVLGLSILRRSYADATGHVPPQYFYASPEWVMVFMLVVTFAVVSFFDGEFKRFDHELRLSPTYRPTAASFGLLTVPTEHDRLSHGPAVVPVRFHDVDPYVQAGAVEKKTKQTTAKYGEKTLY